MRSFHPRTLPPMLRANFARELVSWMFLPLMLGAIEGGTMSIIVKKAFAGAPGITPGELDWAVAFVTAAPNIANVTSFVWASLSHGRAKVPFIAALQPATAILVGLIAAVPANAWGLWLLVVLLTLARTTWSGVLTIRTAVWGANYPRADRARIAGKMATVQSLALALVGALIGWAMDIDERAFHVLFPLAAVGGLVGNAIYRKVRLRGQRRLARAELEGRVQDRPRLNPVSIVHVLRDDPMYRRFMLWMFIFGLGNLMLTAPLAIVLNDGFHVDYLVGILVTTAIPAALMPLTIPAWSRLLDRRHVVEFRCIHSWSFVLASLCQFIGAAVHSLALFFVGAVFTGVAFGGGVLAWNLGHHDFAPAARDSQYMGVHVTLNGIRGLMAPLLAVWIYRAIDTRHDTIDAMGALTAMDATGATGAGGAGFWVFGVCLVLNVIGALGFLRLRAQMRAAAIDGAIVRGH